MTDTDTMQHKYKVTMESNEPRAEDIALPPILGQEQPSKRKYQCNQCARSFDTASGLSMHKVRKHSGKTWSTFRKKKLQSRAERLEKRREYNRKWRAGKTGKKGKITTVITEKPAGRKVTFCPVCGTNIGNVQAAVNLGG